MYSSTPNIVTLKSKMYAVIRKSIRFKKYITVINGKKYFFLKISEMLIVLEFMCCLIKKNHPNII